MIVSFSKIFEKSALNQYYATFCANLLTISMGVCIGWASPNIPKLVSEDSPLPSGKLTPDEVSNVISMSCMGGFLGNFFYAYLADRYGRKLALIAAGPLQFLGWLIIYLARNPFDLMIARFLLGWSGAPVFNVLNIYVAEISEDRIRGFLGSWMSLVNNVGILFGYCIGSYFPYEVLPLIMMPIPCIFIVLMAFIPESPQYLVEKQNLKEAEKALKYFRNSNESDNEDKIKSIEAELELFKKVIEHRKISTEKLTLKDFKEKTGRKPLFYGIALIAVEVFCGGHAMLSYTSTIFQESGSSLNPNDSSIVVALIQIFGSYVSTLLVERAGRKILMSLSCIGSAVGLIVLAIFAYCNKLEINVEFLNWIPLASFSIIIFVQNVGILSIPFLYLAEISPQKIKGFINSFNIGLSWFYTYLTLKYMHTFMNLIGMHGTMLVFAVISFVGAIFVMIFIPETKGKNIEEIIQILEK